MSYQNRVDNYDRSKEEMDAAELRARLASSQARLSVNTRPSTAPDRAGDSRNIARNQQAGAGGQQDQNATPQGYMRQNYLQRQHSPPERTPGPPNTLTAAGHQIYQQHQQRQQQMLQLQRYQQQQQQMHAYQQMANARQFQQQMQQRSQASSSPPNGTGGYGNGPSAASASPLNYPAQHQQQLPPAQEYSVSPPSSANPQYQAQPQHQAQSNLNAPYGSAGPRQGGEYQTSTTPPASQQTKNAQSGGGVDGQQTQRNWLSGFSSMLSPKDKRAAASREDASSPRRGIEGSGLSSPQARQGADTTHRGSGQQPRDSRYRMREGSNTGQTESHSLQPQEAYDTYAGGQRAVSVDTGSRGALGQRGSGGGGNKYELDLDVAQSRPQLKTSPISPQNAVIPPQRSAAPPSSANSANAVTQNASPILKSLGDVQEPLGLGGKGHSREMSADAMSTMPRASSSASVATSRNTQKTGTDGSGRVGKTPKDPNRYVTEVDIDEAGEFSDDNEEVDVDQEVARRTLASRYSLDQGGSTYSMGVDAYGRSSNAPPSLSMAGASTYISSGVGYPRDSNGEANAGWSGMSRNSRPPQSSPSGSSPERSPIAGGYARGYGGNESMPRPGAPHGVGGPYGSSPRQSASDLPPAYPNFSESSRFGAPYSSAQTPTGTTTQSSRPYSSSPRRAESGEQPQFRGRQSGVDAFQEQQREKRKESLLSAPRQEGEEYDVVWNGGPLGIKLRSDGSAQGVPTISALTGNGTASGLNMAAPGDILISINGEPFTTHYEETIQYIMSIEGPVRLRFKVVEDEWEKTSKASIQEPQLDAIVSSVESLSLYGAVRPYYLIWRNGPLGVSLKKDKQMGNLTRIRRVSESNAYDTVVEGMDMCAAGDVLCGVNGQDTLKLSFREIVCLIQRAEKPRVIKFLKLDGPASSRLSTTAPQQRGSISQDLNEYIVVWHGGPVGVDFEQNRSGVPCISEITNRNASTGLTSATVGDELVTIDGQSTSEIGYNRTIQFLQQMSGKTVLVFRKPGNQKRASRTSIPIGGRKQL